MTTRVAVPALLLLTGLAFACANGVLPTIRKATYPPSFDYVTGAEIEGVMGQLAVRIDELQEIMWRTEGVQPEDRARVIELLAEMQDLARELRDGTRSNHPRIDRAAPWLQDDLERALHGARSNPPDYYHAGLVPGACEYCHEPRHGRRRAATPGRVER